MAKLTVLIGAPGSGKSTYAAQLPNATVVTTDNSRGNPCIKGEVLHDAYRQINQHLAAGRDVVFDMTGANPSARKAAVTIAKKHNAQINACVIDTPLQTCLDAQKTRSRPVADAEVRRIHAAIPRSAAQLQAEGFQDVRTQRRK